MCSANKHVHYIHYKTLFKHEEKLKINFKIYFMYGCFVYVYMYASHMCLMPTRPGESELVISHQTSSWALNLGPLGDQQTLSKNCRAISPVLQNIQFQSANYLSF